MHIYKDILTGSKLDHLAQSGLARRCDVTNQGFNFAQQVWDTGGQERYRPVLTTCYRNAHGIIVVYDVTNEKSFTNLSQWMTEVDEFAKSDLPKMLVKSYTTHWPDPLTFV